MRINFVIRYASYKVYGIVAILLCLTTTLFAQQNKYPTAEIESYYDLNFTKAERDSFLTNLQDFQKSLQTIHQYKLDNAVPMSLIFDPVPPGFAIETLQRPIDWGLPKDIQLPENKNELAFYPVYKLAALIKSKKITSTELTRLYLDRLKKFADTLQCATVVLEETALKQAKKADEEIALPAPCVIRMENALEG